MARPVYSTQFIRESASGAWTEHFTVPTGYVAVIRDIRVALAGGSGGQILVTETTSGCYLYQLGQTTSSQFTGTEMRAVLQAGDELQVQSTSTGLVTALVSGYLLTS